jgi:hypothetical protein
MIGVLPAVSSRRPDVDRATPEPEVPARYRLESMSRERDGPSGYSPRERFFVTGR